MSMERDDSLAEGFGEPERRGQRRSPSVQASGAAVLLAALVVVMACEAKPVCEEGAHEGSLVMKDDEYLVDDGLGGDGLRAGRLGDGSVARCREIHGSLIFSGGISSFADFDALEYVSGSVLFRETGYPMKEIDGQQREVIEGFESLLRVDGTVASGMVNLGMGALEHVGGDLVAPGSGYVSLREVGGEIVAGGPSFAYLSNLEVVGGDFVTASGDFPSLSSLRLIGGTLTVTFADEVDFSPPALEEVGRDLIVQQNRAIVGFSAPRLGRIGGRAHVYSNGFGEVGISEVIAQALSVVQIGGDVLVCGNGRGEDPCPWAAECWEYFGSDYCCGEDRCQGHVVCRASTQFCD